MVYIMGDHAMRRSRLRAPLRSRAGGLLPPPVMDKLASRFLLWMGLLHPLFSLPVSGPPEAPLQLPAPDAEARLALEALGRATLLRLLPAALGAGKGAELRGTDTRETTELINQFQNRFPEPQTDAPHPRGTVRKAPSGQEPHMLLSHLLASSRQQQPPPGAALECFWKYCV
nr:urotensin-2 [Cavia porcellus]